MDKPQLRKLHSLFKQEGSTPHVVSQFQSLIWRHYRQHGRTFPWRETDNPYHILVSEIMLQQTQTSRVVSKYSEFVSTFPDFFVLARAPLRDVLLVWQGLGYNRRALALQRTAREVVAQFDGELPADPEVLRKFPGIGQYTAAAIAAIAFNTPTVFLETNIRTVFLHHFFKKSEKITDRNIFPLVEATLVKENPREWYYALFDYGAMLKRERKAITGITRHRQSPFRGSNREMRGQIIRLLLTRESIAEQELAGFLNEKNGRVRKIITQMQEEGIIDIVDGLIRIK
ncbi:MAG: A/G-specific adenine glycosylase [Candidatus Hermodarchaeia archaeon]|jgi:A/G-specific adenine glycosylase